MTKTRCSSADEIRAALQDALASVGLERRVDAVRRQANAYESTHRAEVVNCTLDDGSRLTLLCKHGPSVDRNDLGLVHGLSYEQEMYRGLCEELGDLVPRFYGACRDPGTDVTWLFLEYLGPGQRLTWGPPERALPDAGATIGRLHRTFATHPLLHAGSPINRYDRRYFAACLDAAARAAERLGQRPFVERLADEFGDGINVLLAAPETVIHGEYTPHNILWIDGRPRIVDWEETAIGPGELDLALLTVDWSQELVELTNAAYLQARWPEGPQHDFSRTLAAARIYWRFRWLSDPRHAAHHDAPEWIAWIAERLDDLGA